MTSIHEVLIQHGYKLIDDAWSEPARRTYDHNDEANREFIASLAKVLAIAGWETHPNILRAFRRPINSGIFGRRGNYSELGPSAWPLRPTDFLCPSGQKSADRSIWFR